jgi:hypothetical protein
MSFDELPRPQRRRLLARSAVRVTASIVVLILLYSLLPVVGESGLGASVGVGVGLCVFAALLAWQVRSIVEADHPALRAAEAFAVAVPTVIVVFAFTYLSISKANRASFSEPLDHIGAIYYTVSVLGTVGFGDIVAKSQLARLLVTFQIVLDLVLVVGIARALVFAARLGQRRQRDDPVSKAPETET